MLVFRAAQEKAQILTEPKYLFLSQKKKIAVLIQLFLKLISIIDPNFLQI